MEGNGYLVRRANASDALALRAIRLESLLDTPDAYGSTYEDVSRWSDARWRRIALESNFYIAERDGQVVGMASGGSNNAHPGTHWLFAMYVSPDARGTGVAAALVHAVSTWARREHADALFLHVTERVARARGFYEKLGFRYNGERISMDRDPSITLVTMELALD
ncbi:MAG: GNAT family N-acetyltransferase [Acidimicrobiales bacterium]